MVEMGQMASVDYQVNLAVKHLQVNLAVKDLQVNLAVKDLQVNLAVKDLQVNLAVKGHLVQKGIMVKEERGVPEELVEMMEKLVLLGQ